MKIMIATRRYGIAPSNVALPAMALATLLILSCGDDTTSPPPPPPAPVAASITLSPDSVVMVSAGDTVRIRATVLDAQRQTIAGAAVTWTSSAPAVATVDAMGLVTGVKAGLANITATSGSATAMISATVLNPDKANLVKLYQALGGENWYQKDNWLSDEPLSKWRGVTVDSASGRVTQIILPENDLEGTLPPEIGAFPHLRVLVLPYNRITGQIPPEIGNLTELRDMAIEGNSFSGPIPPEIGRLTKMEFLSMGEGQLSGSLPSELGNLANLQLFILYDAQIEGAIPATLGRLSNLWHLEITDTRLSGSIPAELASLTALEVLNLGNNRLSGALPALTGMTALRSLNLWNNADLSGPLPEAMTSLKLQQLTAHGTGLCLPAEPAFRTWLASIAKHRIPFCGGQMAAEALLTQVTQSREFPVPLVAGESALLRVFVTSSQQTTATLPPVRATFFVNGTEVHVENIDAGSATIPTEVQVGMLDLSANATIPAKVIQPGLEMVVEIDPEGTADASLGVMKRIPAEGRAAVDVKTVPPLHFTLVPFISTTDNDSAAAKFVENAKEDGADFWLSANLLPVGDFEIKKHASVTISSQDIGEVLDQTERIRTMENGTGHWMGLLPKPADGAVGVAYLGAKVAASDLDSVTIAHELGHNLSLEHADGCQAGGPDRSFPWAEGKIGVWGYDPRDGKLVSPDMSDLMTYCTPPWISDYYFTNALRYRVLDTTEVKTMTSEPMLLVSGRVGGDGTLRLDPAFVVDAAPALPTTGGPYRVIGRRTNGGELFSVSFGLRRAPDGDGGAGFVFALPARPEWAAQLASLALVGPEGEVEVREGSEPPMAILRDPSTGQVRAILRDLPPGPAAYDEAEARAPEPGLEVVVSTGLPRALDWGR